MIININDNKYCCNGFCDKKNECFRFVFRHCADKFQANSCMYLHNDKDKCFVPIEEDNK